MKAFRFAVVAVVLSIVVPLVSHAASVEHPRCEYLANPLGIGEKQPRLSWVMMDGDQRSEVRGQKQTAYHVLVASAPEILAENRGDLWDSGKVKSDQTIHVVYEGKPLKSRTFYYWKVRIYDEDGKPSAWSKPAMWSTGFFDESQWEAPWIADTFKPEPGKEDLLRPTTMLRNEFELNGKVKRAMLTITGLGLYEARINGKKVGERVLSPEHTLYAKRIQYQTYDVTTRLNSGRNAIGVLLSDGWHSGMFHDRQGNSRRKFKGQRGLRLRMDIELEDGKTTTVVSDPTWVATDDGPSRICCLYNGESYDGCKEMPGWDQPGFNDSKWDQTRIVEFPGAKLVSQPNEPLRVGRELKPVKVTEKEKGVYVFDLGQNMTGWCRLLIKGCPEGREVTLQHVERFNDDGSVRVWRHAQQKDSYICAGRELEVFEPRFTYRGFRYVEVRGLETKPEAQDLTGRVVYSVSPETGSFECSNALINQFMMNVFRSQIGNMTSTPTDCPTREKAGWMGDIQPFCQSAMFNMDMGAFLTKWLADVRDSQAPDGRFPHVAPLHLDCDYRVRPGTPGWGDAGLFVPWRMYQNYADTRLLKEHIDAARRHIDYVHKHNPELLWLRNRGRDYNDWLNGDKVRVAGFPRRGNSVPPEVLATAFWHQSTRMLSNMYRVLGRTEDAKKYAELANGIREAFNKTFVDEEGKIKGDTQAGYALALSFGLLDETRRKQAVAHLLEAIQRYNGHLSTGFQSTPHVMLELSRNGQHDEACRLMNLRECPSWGYMIDVGATTIWEHWDGYVEGRGFQGSGNSLNHYAFGAAAEWVWRYLAGLNPDDDHPGWKHFTIAPMPHETVTWARAEYNSIRGLIKSDWRVENGRMTLDVTIPPNTTATVYVPAHKTEDVAESGRNISKSPGVKFLSMSKNRAVLKVEAGRYRFVSSNYE